MYRDEYAFRRKFVSGGSNSKMHNLLEGYFTMVLSPSIKNCPLAVRAGDL